MQTSRKSIQIPAVTLRLLIGEGAILPQAFRRSHIERYWPCGCIASYDVSESATVKWTPCAKHDPAS
jgi:hypothetical protein